MYTNKNIKVSFDEEEIKFLEWLAKRDKVSINEELIMIFYTEFNELKEYFAEEYDEEQK